MELHPKRQAAVQEMLKHHPEWGPKEIEYLLGDQRG
jgi:hypothetical protein